MRATRLSSTSALSGLALIALLVGAGAAAWLGSTDPFAIVAAPLLPPTSTHAFGTDDLGRDVLTGVLHGAWTSLVVGLSAAAISAIVGLVVGGLAGIRGGVVDHILMRGTEFVQALPRFFLVVVVVSLFGHHLAIVVLVIGFTAWPAIARVFRAQVLSFAEWDFVAAARAAGAGDLRIVATHIVPLALPVIVTQVAYQAGGAILAEAGLSFLGLQDPRVMSWGTQLGAAQHFVREAWWMSAFPGIAVCIAVVGCNLVADAFAEDGIGAHAPSLPTGKRVLPS